VKQRAFDFLMGVGKKYYPSPEHFIREAKTMGVSKRLPFVPRGLVFGKSKIFLVHWKEKNIFAFFIPVRLDVIADPEKSAKLRKELKDAGAEVKDISASRAIDDDVRGCGSRVVGGIYAVTANDEESRKKANEIMKKYANDKDTIAEIGGGLAVLKNPIQYTDKFFRGIRYFYCNIKTGRYFLLKNPFSRRK